MPRTRQRTTSSRSQTAIKARTFNRKAHWQAYKQLQMQTQKAWKKFYLDVKRNVRPEILIKDHNHLLLLLGECNYMAGECMRMLPATRRR